MEDYKEYSFGDDRKVPLDDINLPTEVKEYIENLCEVKEVSFEMYPYELLSKNIIVSTWCAFDLNVDNVEFRSFNLFEKIQYDVFCQGVTFYEKEDDNTPGYMVYQYLNDKSVVVIKV